MLEFIIVCFIAIAIEAARRYFIAEKYSQAGEPLLIHCVFCLVIAAVMIFSWYWHEWVMGLLVFLGFWIEMLACSIYFSPTSSNSKMTSEEKRQCAAFFLSWLIPLAAIICVVGIGNCKDSAAFEAKWLETAPLTISCQPLKTIVNGNETVVLECTEAPGNISFGVDKYGFDVLKLEESDKVRYLKELRRERFEIITLKGAEYKKRE